MPPEKTEFSNKMRSCYNSSDSYLGMMAKR
jgi:hypothetical protein